MTLHHTDWELGVMFETTDELANHIAREHDPKLHNLLEVAMDFRHYYGIAA